MMYKNKIQEIDEINEKIKKFRPINQSFLKQVREYFRIGLTYSSNALEGNTLTETETKVILEDGLTIGGKSLREHYEAAGHSDAYDKICILAKKKSISEKDILEIHRLFYYRIDIENAGKYRKDSVIITGTDYIPPSAEKVPHLMQKFVKKIPSIYKKNHPVVASALIHKEFVDIHPFVDGNGRTARLLMNLVLFQNGYLPAVIPPILRADYIKLIRKSQTGTKDSTEFINFISAMVCKSTRDYFRMLNVVE